MSENYIHIYTSYISDVFQRNKFSVQDVYELLAEFEKVCEHVQNRQALVVFIDSYLAKYPQLQELKNRLLDPEFIFPPAPTEQE